MDEHKNVERCYEDALRNDENVKKDKCEDTRSDYGGVRRGCVDIRWSCANAWRNNVGRDYEHVRMKVVKI